MASVPSQSTPATAEAGAAQRASRREAAERTDLHLVARAKRGDSEAYERIVHRYRGFVRLKTSSYFLLGADQEDLVQEGMVGLYKAVRDFRTDRESSFRNFAELCVTRQMITAVKTASRNKHQPLNRYVSFAQSPAAPGETDATLEDFLPGPASADPASSVVATEELSSLVECLTSTLSELESQVLTLYLDDCSYEEIAEELERDTKTVDNALQRVKRKIGIHLASREVSD